MRTVSEQNGGACLYGKKYEQEQIWAILPQRVSELSNRDAAALPGFGGPESVRGVDGKYLGLPGMNQIRSYRLCGNEPLLFSWEKRCIRTPESVNISAGIAVKHLAVEGCSVLRSKRQRETVGMFEERRDAY
jgi:hypothetical protein